MSALPPWFWLLCALLLFSALAGWVLHRGIKKQVQAVQGDVQAQSNRDIQRQHLAELDRSLAEGRLTSEQHAMARDELLLLVQGDVARATPSAVGPNVQVRLSGLVLTLAVLSGLTYIKLGAPNTWWPLPLSQRVQITAGTPEQLAKQTLQWQQKVQTRPEDAEAWLTLARLHAAQNAYALAEQALAKVLALSPEPDLWVDRAQMKALSVGGVFTSEPWQWIESVLQAQPQHLNALVLAGTAALSENRHEAARHYWQQALSQLQPDSEAAQSLQQAMAQAAEMALAKQNPTQNPAQNPAQNLTQSAPTSAVSSAPLIQGEVRVSSAVQSQLAAGATLFVYAVAEEGSRRPVAIWRTNPSAWPVRFALNDSMGMGAPPLLSSLSQVRLVARISKTGSAQKQSDDWQVELAGVKTGVQGVVLDITGR